MVKTSPPFREDFVRFIACTHEGLNINQFFMKGRQQQHQLKACTTSLEYENNGSCFSCRNPIQMTHQENRRIAAKKSWNLNNIYANRVH